MPLPVRNDEDLTDIPYWAKGSEAKKGDRSMLSQLLLLKALRVTQDPIKLRDMIGAKKVVDVYKTFDKLAMRQEFQKALSENGMTFDRIVSDLRDVADTSKNDFVRLKVIQILMKSLGVENYSEADAQPTSSWEDEIMKKLSAEERKKELNAPVEEYEVNAPQVPESIRRQREIEREIGGL